MRPLEVLLFAATGIGAVWAIGPWRGRRLPAAAVVVLGVAAMVLQADVEGVRWQLLPAQAAVVLLAATGAVVVVRNRAVAGQRVVGTLAVVLALAAAGGAWALPVEVLPDPEGEAPVGTVTVALVDDERIEDYGPSPGGPREIVAQVWYPADPGAPSRPAPMVPDFTAFGPTAAKALGLPGFAVGHLALVRSHATPGVDPDLDGAPLPVVVYSHGWQGFRTIHAHLLEDLASHGYVVVAIDHTYGALATAFPDGRVVGLDPDALPEDAAGDEYDEASRQLVKTYAGDILLTLEELAAGAVPALEDHLDLDRVALIGHSTGGGAAVLACAHGRNCDIVVGFDPWVEPVPDDVIGAGLKVPLLSIRSEEWTHGANERRLRRLHAATEPKADEGRVAIDGAVHTDFTVMPLLSPLSTTLGFAGELSGEDSHEIVSTWTRRFLDRHLRDVGVDPLVMPPTFAEVTVEKADKDD